MKKGFTLVELLAVIVILAVILVIAVPKITNVISDTKESTLLSSAKLIAKSAEQKYAENELLENTNEITCSSVAKINSDDYDYCTISLREGIAYVNIIGKGKFEGIGVYGVTKDSGNIGSKVELANNDTNLATRVLLNKTTTNNTEGLNYDDFGNLRYSGANPNNYISFNNELWRIIGIFEVSNGSKTEKRIKIVRNSFSTSMSWDSSDSTINSGYGVNEWKNSDLSKVLNGYYIGRSTTCNYCNGQNQETCPNDCTSKITPLSASTLSLVENAVWNLGGNDYTDPSEPPFGLPLIKQYNAERGNVVYSGRSTTWTGLVGLLYPSDYGYSSTNESCRTDLRVGVVYKDSTWNFDDIQCKNDNWLHNGLYWTISPYSTYANLAFYVFEDGAVAYDYAYTVKNVRPAIYLKSTIKITNSNTTNVGTISNPYQISL